MNVIYLDCSAGISGDMMLGALVDAGLDPDDLRAALGRLDLRGFDLRFETGERSGIRGTRAVVEIEETGVHRGLPDLEEILDRSSLPDRVRERSRSVFRRLAEAESAVHGVPVERVHFHEVGAVDAIVDVVGAVSGIELLGAERLYTSELHFGRGSVTCAHGTLPVPVPAVARLCRGFPVRFTATEGEMTTPTGAALATTLADAVGLELSMVPEAEGYGFGARIRAGFPNALRLFRGRLPGPGEAEEVLLLETNLDDLSGQAAAFAMEACRAAGALDVFATAVQMKKSRPGVKISVLCTPQRSGDLAAILQRECGTLGVRSMRCSRFVVERSVEAVETSLGRVRIKRFRQPGGAERFSLEYDDLARLALERKEPIEELRRRLEGEIETL